MNTVIGAILGIGQNKNFSENFSRQELFLDISNYNSMTGEKYENAISLQNINRKVDLSGFRRGDVVEVKFFLGGRFYKRADGSSAFIQNLRLAGIERKFNTKDEAIRVSEEDLIAAEIPE